MRLRSALAVVASLLLVLLVPPLASTGTDSGADAQIRGLRMLVPNSPGGGYDITARTAVKAMEDAELNAGVEVFNLPGAGGTVGLGRVVNERGNGKLAMSMGLGVVGSVYTNHSPVSLQDTTPVAKLIEESNVVVVGKDSPYRDLDQLIADWKARPGDVPVGGGSSPGGPDHLAPMLMARAVGLSPKQVNYVPFDGGGELLASVLGGKVAFGVSGIGEYRDQIEAGELRVLAVTGKERLPGVDAPTLTEAGVDVEFTNWRGIVAPPGLSEPDRRKLVTLFTRLNKSPEWQDALRRNGWTEAFAPGEQFGAFLRQENDRVASVLKELGLA
ncbi:putative tricarboxylic transport membrane protein [Saccharopolyspora erythraea NRRL 2338]|uniref:Tricarboxylic transport membrane protein n=2 Tax=Saccharopolyspora erythraea TaxID=1836 RepID=A4FKM3_SACEN|nr:tripartite tricarboxylate transporter substrate binding protein [Saccharopolyspora erythraea]EQD83092.1 C4-dicarboxylate ABC transporter substrate-binding protein [Saccharopolyspora erythraea D]PFG98236.1 putative tricarboxylic transport membrane protein [Saccharopolyspora erythraea NRRL 2338]QRK88332.1 tripartite tricarboxylate transporter substrate binding protein [Saccharopolyspora erythraea]CAM04598.1 putative tricarboxylic transport membrane protein [Saccharopolyspora erythraea NRRL 233